MGKFTRLLQFSPCPSGSNGQITFPFSPDAPHTLSVRTSVKPLERGPLAIVPSKKVSYDKNISTSGLTTGLSEKGSKIRVLVGVKWQVIGSGEFRIFSESLDKSAPLYLH